MNAEVRVLKSPVETALAEAFTAAKRKLPGTGEVGRLREAAFHRFEKKGLPNRRVEEWKYTDLRAAMREAKPLAGPPDAAAKLRAKEAGALLAGVDCRRLVFIDGVFVSEASDLVRMEPGLTIRSLAEALSSGDALTKHIGKVAPSEDPALALNTSFMSDGALVHVAAGSRIARPLHLVFVTASANISAFPRSLVVVEKGAALTLVESHEGWGSDSQVNTALELVIGDRAEVDHLKITTGDATMLHVSSLMASVGAHARYNDFAFTTGGAVVRNQLFICCHGKNSVLNLRGATLLKGRQHADTTLILDHSVGGCTSREVYKSVLDDEAHGVFQGKIIVRPHAQKTDAKMMTRALLLSEAAEANAKPELEIFADDVQCGHGATTGALDEDLLFYLRARGIPAKEAEALMIQAFIGEAVDEIAHEGLREALMGAAVEWLQARG
ncbi:MAG: Fe-S cluster assembly protein SufD [Alphaproteobacteria bacterium]|nr:Fe-S cluster assembly protein SufD [Alphaproteobacteria bacterium]